MYGALVVIVLALSGCAAYGARTATAGAGREQLKGFLYVGAAALVVLAVAVIVVGLTAGRPAQAEGLAVFGCFTYVLYLLAALAITALTARRRPSDVDRAGQDRVAKVLT